MKDITLKDNIICNFTIIDDKYSKKNIFKLEQPLSYPRFNLNELISFEDKLYLIKDIIHNPLEKEINYILKEQ